VADTKAAQSSNALDRLAEHVVGSITDANLFASFFRPAESWARWLTVLRCLFGLPLAADELALFTRCTGRSKPFTEALTEAWLLCGRRSGKSRILSLIAVCLAAFRDYSAYLAPGERAVVMVLAVDKDQAQTIFGYARALIEQTPMLAQLVESETADTLDLTNGVSIEVHTSSYKSVRGRTLAAALCDEAAFWRSDESRNPAAAVIAALRPGLSTIPGAPLLCASSTYDMSGPLYEAFVKHHGQDESDVMVWKSDTSTMNPTFRHSVIDKAYADDPLDAAAEYGSEFRAGISAFLEEEWIQAAIDSGCFERPPSPRFRYHAFVDPSGGRRDSFTLGIAHRQGDIALLDVAKEWRAPLDPAVVVTEIASALKPHGVTSVIGDAYAGEWVASAFRAAGVKYITSEKTRSEIYLEAGPLLAQGRIRLIDQRRLTGQLRQLERRTSPGGQDRVNHPPGGQDDVANSAMGALWLASQRSAVPQGELMRPGYTITGDSMIDAENELLASRHRGLLAGSTTPQQRAVPMTAGEYNASALRHQNRNRNRFTLT
jgi:hypothetical protein